MGITPEHAVDLIANLDGTGLARALRYLEDHELVRLTEVLEQCQPAEPSPPSRETDFGWWRTRDSLQVRLSWREATRRLYLFHPFNGNRDLGEFPSGDELRGLLADLDRNRPEDFSEALFRLTGSGELPR